VVADYVGVTLLHTHHGVAAGPAESAALAFGAGLDIETPGDDCAPHLREALAKGLIAPAKVDEIVLRVLTEKFRVGLFERPYADEGAVALQAPATVSLAREVAREAVVVLENRGVLPLAPGQKVAVIGPTADDPLGMLCGYSFPVHLILSDVAEQAGEVVTPRAGLVQALGAESVVYARGCDLLEKRQKGAPVFPGDVPDSAAVEGRGSPVSTRTDLIPAAVAAARGADVAVVCVGDLAGLFQTGTVGEGSDADSLVLPGVQQALLEAVVATGKPVVVVLTAGRPYTLGGLEGQVAALVMAHQGGQEGGAALAEVLTGQVEPSGRLAVSFPKSVGAVPYYYDHKFKSSGTPIAFHFGSRFPFGHGLAYTTFELSGLAVEQGAVPADGEVRATFTVRNTGARPGVAVPQLYVRDRLASLVRPVKELKAFGRIALQPGQEQRVAFSVPVDMLSFTGPDGHRVVEPGEFELQLGASSADIRARATVAVTGGVRRLSGAWRMESACELLP